MKDGTEDVISIGSDLEEPEDSNGLDTVLHRLSGNLQTRLTLVTEMKKVFSRALTRLQTASTVLRSSIENLETVDDGLELSVQYLDPCLDGDGCCALLRSCQAQPDLPNFAAEISKLELEETLDMKWFRNKCDLVLGDLIVFKKSELELRFPWNFWMIEHSRDGLIKKVLIKYTWLGGIG